MKIFLVEGESGEDLLGFGFQIKTFMFGKCFLSFQSFRAVRVGLFP